MDLQARKEDNEGVRKEEDAAWNGTNRTGTAARGVGGFNLLTVEIQKNTPCGERTMTLKHNIGQTPPDLAFKKELYRSKEEKEEVGRDWDS